MATGDRPLASFVTDWYFDARSGCIEFTSFTHSGIDGKIACVGSDPVLIVAPTHDQIVLADGGFRVDRFDGTRTVIDRDAVMKILRTKARR